MAEELKACPHGRNFCLECHYDPASPSKTLPQMYDDLLAENAALRAQLPSQRGEAVEVVAWRHWGDKTRLLCDLGKQRAIPGTIADEFTEPLMTVAQHQRIVAASVPAGCKAVPVELLERLEHVTRTLAPHLQCHADLRALLEVKS